MDKYAVKNAIQDFREDMVAALEILVDALTEEQEVAAPLAKKPRVQARLQGHILHLQYGLPGDYKRADMEVTAAELVAFQAFDNVEVVPSLAGSGRPYVEGSVLPDGRIQFGDVVIPSPFWSSGARPRSA